MKASKPFLFSTALLIFSVALPSVAYAGKESRKPAETAAPSTINCKQTVRPMGEAMPVRKGECPKVRRILM